jgi:quinoprotein glucose dehydrogenase
MKKHKNETRAALGAMLCAVAAIAAAQSRGASPELAEFEWSSYGADVGGSRYAPLTRIHRGNVTRLQPAWTYRTGASGDGFASTPILVGDTLYLSTPTNIVIALDASNGRERWRFDPKLPRDVQYPEVISRGVASWRDEEAAPGAACAHRIFIGTLDARLLAIDAATGLACSDFGDRGSVNLAEGTEPSERHAYAVTSPPTIHGDLVIVGASGSREPLSDRVLRAFDARTGQLRWSWLRYANLELDVAQPPRSGVSASSAMSVDDGRGLLFVPTGSAGFRYFSGARPEDHGFANALLAVRAQTGETVWHRQLVRRDLWNLDLAAQPLLIDIEREGQSIPAVVQATRAGQLFVFDRETGEPVFEIVERPVPGSEVPDEQASPTQPFPATPPLISHAAVTAQDAWGLTFVDRAICRRKIAIYRSEGIFTPPDTRGSIATANDASGVNWGSLAYDPERQLVIAAATYLPVGIKLVPRAEGAYEVEKEPLISPLGLPCVAPPWGTLSAVDLRRNVIRWQVTLGSTRASTPWFVPSRTLGMPNLGGPIVTAGGLVFIAAATDNHLRAFDTESGRELWKARLPAGGHATPMTYEIGDRQFVVIAAGGHSGLGTPAGDYVVAFALRP